MLLGVVFVVRYGPNAVVFPFILEATGVLSSMVGIALVREWKGISPTKSLLIGLFTTAIVSSFGLYFLSTLLLNDVTLFFAGLLGLSAMLASIGVTIY
jgi:K(+)-stimulated pyrophosphate-energized sodium pump